MTPADFLVIAHRGASAYAPENTLAAFDLARQLGCRHLERDVDLSRDGQIVVMHDDTVDRTTNGTGPVGSHTLAELRALDAGAWFGPQFTGGGSRRTPKSWSATGGGRTYTPSLQGVRHIWPRVRQTWCGNTAW